jgi:hypothetical protein
MPQMRPRSPVPLAPLVVRYGQRGSITLPLTAHADCPSDYDPCAAQCPDLPKVRSGTLENEDCSDNRRKRNAAHEEQPIRSFESEQ